MKVGIRVDCNDSTGLGHFNRSFILAKILGDFNQIIFISMDELSLNGEFKLYKIQNNEIYPLGVEVNKLGLDVLVLDVYSLINPDFDYKSLFRSKVILFDDFGFDYKCDFIIRQNIFSERKIFRILTGINFILANNLILSKIRPKKKDIYHYTFYISEYLGKEKIIESFIKKNSESKISILSNYENLPFLSDKKFNIKFYGRVSIENVFKVLDRSEVLIVPASLISMEGYLNNNKLILYYESSDQRNIYDTSIENNSILKIDKFENILKRDIKTFISSKKTKVNCPSFNLVRKSYMDIFSKI